MTCLAQVERVVVSVSIQIDHRPPVVADHQVVTLSSEGAFCSYDLDNGEQEWTEQPGYLTAGPLSNGDKVAVDTRDKVLFFDPSNGCPTWKNPPTLTQYGLREVVGSPKGLVVARDQVDSFIVVDPEAEEVLWRWTPRSTVTTSVTADQQGLLLMGCSTDLVAFDITKGELAWESKQRFNISSVAAGDEGQVYVGFNFGQVVELDARGQPTGWSRKVSARPALAYHDGVLVSSAEGGQVKGFRRNGEGSDWSTSV